MWNSWMKIAMVVSPMAMAAWIGQRRGGDCVNSAGDMPPGCWVNTREGSPYQYLNEEECQALCETFPGCLGVAYHYYCNKIYYDPTKGFSTNDSHDNICNENSGDHANGPFDIVCPQAENNQCGDGLPVMGCYKYLPDTTTAVTVTTSVTTGTTVTETTATETWPLVVNCSLTRIRCPVPRVAAGGNYVLKGNENAAPGQRCGPPQPDVEPMYFDVQVDACNVTVTKVSEELTVLAVTLVPNISEGTIVFEEVPTIVCRCNYDTLGGVGTSVSVDLAPTGPINVNNESSFDPVMNLFTDGTFTNPIISGEQFPLASDRFYVQITSSYTDDIIGVPDCMASPTSGSNALNQSLLDSYCDETAFDIDYDNIGSATHQVRWSMKKFKFAGYQRVYLTCEVVRCATSPCGTCIADSNGRRLQEKSRETALFAIDLPPRDGDYIILPFSNATSDRQEATNANTDRQTTNAKTVPFPITLISFLMVALALTIAVAIAAIAWRFHASSMRKSGQAKDADPKSAGKAPTCVGDATLDAANLQILSI